MHRFAQGIRAGVVGMAWALLAGVCSGQVAQTATQASLPSTPVGWLRYAIPPDPPRYHDMPHAVVVLGDAPEETEAAEELDRGLGHMVAGTDMLLHRFDPRVDAIVLGTTDALRRARLNRLPGWSEMSLPEEGFRIVRLRRGIRQWWILQGGSPRAELWAAFRFAALVAADQQLPAELVESPKIANRMIGVDWHDGDRTWENRDTARLMASVGLNGLAVRGAMTPAALQTLTRSLRPFGIRVWREQTGERRTVSSTSADAHGAALPLVHGAFHGQAMSGLGPALAGGMGAVVAEFPLTPAGVRMPALPMESWESALRTPERQAGTLLEAVTAGGLLGRMQPEVAEALFGNPLLQANLYAFGRMAWDPAMPADAAIDEWARQTWGNDARVFAVAKSIVLNSAEAYVDLASPMGLPPLVDATGEGPRMAGATALADRQGVGVDHTAELAGYPETFAAELRDPAQTPDRWLLGVHRVPYNTVLHSGKTVVQAFYDAHFGGASQESNALDAWESTRELVDPERYAAMHALLEEAARRGEVWRESTTEWLLRVSGVPDASGFVGSHPSRTEAESMESKGYELRRSTVPEDASGGAAAVCHSAECTAATHFHGEENVYRIEVGYFNETSASSKFELTVNGNVRAQWTNLRVAGSSSPEWAPSGALAERFVINGIRLKSGDAVELRGTGGEAPLDFLEITRDPRWN